MGMPATGKSVDVQLIDIIRFRDDGLAHEHWGVFDTLAMMQQLGAIRYRLRRRPRTSALEPEAAQRALELGYAGAARACCSSCARVEAPDRGTSP